MNAPPGIHPGSAETSGLGVQVPLSALKSGGPLRFWRSSDASDLIKFHDQTEYDLQN